jgi:hypothetical protein
MKLAKRLVPGILLAGFLLSGACGKKEEQPTRFNRTLGGTPAGAPTGTVHVDTGILQDPTAYKPADYTPLEGGPAAGAAAAGPEVEAVRGAARKLLDGIFALDVDTILDSFVPEQVAVLQKDEYKSTLYETKDTIDAYWAVFQDKATATEFQSLIRLYKLVPQLSEPLVNAITVTLQDEANAVATFDGRQFELPEDFRTAFEEALATSTRMMAQLGLTPGAVGGAPPQPAEPNAAATTPGTTGTPAGGFSLEKLQEEMGTVQVSLSFRRIGDAWKLALPFSLQEEQADLLNEGLLLVKDYFAAVTASIDQAETLDLQTYVQIEMRQQGKVLAFMGWVAQAQAMLTSMMEAPPGEKGAEAAEAEKEQPSEPNAAEEPNAPERPQPGRGGRAP